jgi:hypothetical protein
MDSIEFSVHSNIKEIQKKLSAFAYQQVPFATAQALTAVAKKVRDAESANIKKTLNNPSPFTVKSIRIQAARKDRLYAKVFVMDKAARYLEPYESGGSHVLNSKALLNPKDINLNQYGQLRRGTLAALKARSDIFIGPVKTRKGIVNGVWQRVASVAKVERRRAGKLMTVKTKRGINDSGHLKLLLRFGDAIAVNKRLGYAALGKRIVDANFNREFGRALSAAIATANR